MQEMRMVVCPFMQKLELKFADDRDPEEYDRSLCDYLVGVRTQSPVIMKLREKA